MNVGSLSSARRWFIFVWIIAILPHGAAFAEEPTLVEFDIAAQDLGDALTEFGVQSGTEVYFVSADVAGVQAPRIEGKYSEIDVIQQLLGSSGVEYFIDGNGTLLVGTAYTAVTTSDERGASDSKNSRPMPVLMAQNTTTETQTTANAEEADELGDDEPSPAVNERATRGQIENIVVIGSRNTGIRRYEDDVQPYVVFDSNDLVTSFADNLDEFFRTRLPMNSVITPRSLDQSPSSQSRAPTSTVDLRGLGPDQTLILVNGRRLPSLSRGGLERSQPDINSIPISAIERIEVLPSTASGIYGGGATGGVINIILKKQYTGADITASYGDTFDSSISEYRLDASGGFTLGRGKTDILWSFSYSDGDELTEDERDYAQQARALLLQNNPDQIYNAFFGPASSTVNVTGFRGAELVLDDGTALGSNITFAPTGYPGVLSDGGAALAQNAGRYNLDIPDDFLGSRSTLLSVPKTVSGSIYLTKEMSPWLDLFADATYFSSEYSANRAGAGIAALIPADAPTNPFQTTIVVAGGLPDPSLTPRIETEDKTLQISAGASASLSDNWSAQLEYTWGESENAYSNSVLILENTFAQAVQQGALDVIRDFRAAPIDVADFLIDQPSVVSGPATSRQQVVSARISGTVLELPAGPIRTAAVFEYRDEEVLDSYLEQKFFAEPLTLRPESSRDTTSAYFEALFPLVSKANRVLFVDALEAQLAIRYEDVQTTLPDADVNIAVDSRTQPRPDIPNSSSGFSSSNYTFGLKYQPIEDLAIRASFATGFLPPTLNELRLPSDSVIQPGGLSAADPKRGGETRANLTEIDVISGGNPQLEPEDSESISIGLIFTPQFVEGLRLSVDYTEIEKSNEVVSLSINDLFLYEDLLPGRVSRGPLTPEDAALGFSGGQVIAIDNRSVNAFTSKVEAYDFQLEYTKDLSGIGHLNVYTVATRQTLFENQIALDADLVDRVGYADGPLEWRANAGVSLSRDSWLVGWNAQYFDKYKVTTSNSSEFVEALTIQNQGSEYIDSQIYNDVYGVLKLGELGRPSGWMNGTEVRLSIQNVFDEEPPILAGIFFNGGNGYSTYGDPRERRYTLQINKVF